MVEAGLEQRGIYPPEFNNWLKELQEAINKSNRDGVELPDRGLELYRLCSQSSLYFLAKYVLEFDKLVEHFHRPVAEFIQSSVSLLHLLLLLPRKHFKTTISTISFPIWLLIQDTVKLCTGTLPGCDVRTLLANESSTNSEHMLRLIEQKLQIQFFKILFPELVPSRPQKWSEKECLINRKSAWMESSIETIGVGGAAQSRHYDVIMKDDLVGKEARDSEEVMRKTITWNDYADSLFVGDDGIDIIVGTRWAHFDLYAHILETDSAEDGGQYHNHCRGVIEEGKPIFPERFSLEKLNTIKKKNFFHYMSQYMNDPSDPDATDLSASKIQRYKRQLDKDGNLFFLLPGDEIVWPSFLDRVGGLDPNVGERISSRGSKCAASVYGIDSKGRVFLCENWSERKPGTSAMLDKVFELQKRWKPREFVGEGVAFQKVLGWVFEQEKKRRRDEGKYSQINFVPVHSGKQSKDDRIRENYDELLGNSLLFLPENGFGAEDVEREIFTFPIGRTKDCLDSGAYAIQRLRKPVREEDVEEMEKYEEELDKTRSNLTGY